MNYKILKIINLFILYVLCFLILTLSCTNVVVAQDKSLVDKVTQLNMRKRMVIKESSAKSYKKAEDLISDSDLMFRSKNYSKSFVASKYLGEVW